jgi:hypothetical protein
VALVCGQRQRVGPGIGRSDVGKWQIEDAFRHVRLRDPVVGEVQRCRNFLALLVDGHQNAILTFFA